jgi:uncharacterized membrane protein
VYFFSVAYVHPVCSIEVRYRDQVSKNEGGKQITMRGLTVLKLQVLLFLFFIFELYYCIWMLMLGSYTVYLMIVCDLMQCQVLLIGHSKV